MFRQTDAVVGHFDHHAIFECFEDDFDFTPVSRRTALGFAITFDGFRRILDEVGHRLRDETLVKACAHSCTGHVELKVDVLVALAEQDHRLLHGNAQIGFRHIGRWHARERRELINHTFDLTGLALNRLCQRVEQLAVLRDLLAELVAQALGRELYRRQRVLDFVGDAPRHVRPGTRALGLHQL